MQPRTTERLLPQWQALRAEQKRVHQGLTLVDRFVWRRGGDVELIAKFPSAAEAEKMLLAAGYKRDARGFRP